MHCIDRKGLTSAELNVDSGVIKKIEVVGRQRLVFIVLFSITLLQIVFDNVSREILLPSLANE